MNIENEGTGQADVLGFQLEMPKAGQDLMTEMETERLTPEYTPEYFVIAARERGADNVIPETPAPTEGAPAPRQTDVNFAQAIEWQRTPPETQVISTLDPNDYDNLGDYLEASQKSAEGREVAQDAKVAEESALSTVGSSLLKKGTGLVSSLNQTFTRQALQQYANEMAYFEQQGKYWFNPMNNSVPELDEYLAQMPDYSDALAGSTMTSAAGYSNEAVVVRSAIDPLSWAVSTFYADSDDEAVKLQDYMMNKVGQRGLEGYSSTGSPWGLLYGLVGVVESLIVWDDAQKQDEKRRKEAQQNYFNAVRQYNIQQAQLKTMAQNEYAQRVDAARISRERKEAAEEAKTFSETAARRNALVNFIESFRTSPATQISPSFYQPPGR